MVDIQQKRLKFNSEPLLYLFHLLLFNAPEVGQIPKAEMEGITVLYFKKAARGSGKYDEVIGSFHHGDSAT